jgi:hypothetical protein
VDTDGKNIYLQNYRGLEKLITSVEILHGLIFDQEDGGRIVLGNIRLSKNSTALQIRRQLCLLERMLMRNSFIGSEVFLPVVLKTFIRCSVMPCCPLKAFDHEVR